MAEGLLAYLDRHLTGRRLLVVGQAPARSAIPDVTRPWDSASGRRLAAMMGTTRESLLEVCDTINLNPALLPPSTAKWDPFHVGAARAVARVLSTFLHGWEHSYEAVLCCGARVAREMDAPLLEWRSTTYTERLGGLPHPGGTNRWYNDPGNALAAKQFLSTMGA